MACNCCSCHEHEHEHKENENGKTLSKIQKIIIFRIILSAILLFSSIIICKNFQFSTLQKLVLFLIAYFVIGYDILLEAIKNILHGEFFDENFLMSIATVGAFCLGEYSEAVFVMLFAQIGEFFEDYAVKKSKNSIKSLMDIRADSANIEKNG